jgi:hypothetical protein
MFANLIFNPVEADAGAASSFVVFENGKVSCTERFYQADQTGAAAFGLAAFFILYFAAIVFVGSFVVTLVLAMVGLEILIFDLLHRFSSAIALK